MIENRFVTSEEVFVPMAAWDACVNPQLRPVPADNTMRVWAAVDASVKHDSTAIACMTWHRDVKKARLVWHRIFQPSPDRSLDFEATIEQTLLELKRRFSLKEVRFDPWQMRATAQRLRRMGVPMVEFPQSIPNLTAASQNLFELIKSQGLMVYPDPDIRLAVSRAVAVEGSRGWKIAKEKSSHKIDIVVALAMAALATVQKGEAKQMRTGTYNPCGGDAHVHYKKDESQEFSRYRYITINADGSETSETRLLPRTGGGR
jgi:phage terminase large subunit-like protein